MSSTEDIALAGQIAASLETCGWPKPGNVHRTSDFPDTTFEHFITGSIVIGPALRLAARRGLNVGIGRIPYDAIGVGRLIKRAVSDVKGWHRGGNSHLGISMLFVPLAAAAGVSLSSSRRIRLSDLRRAVEKVIKLTTPMDAIDLYETVRMVGGEWWGRLCSKNGPPDLKDPKASKKIMEGGINLYEVMRYSAAWDDIAQELVTGMQVSFEVGYSTFIDTYTRHKDVNVATVHTFLTILSRNRDTFIARKSGLEKGYDIREASKIGVPKAQKVSQDASRVLGLGGLLTNEGRRALSQMDEELYMGGSALNPGTTADMTASSIYIALLMGFRP